MKKFLKILLSYAVIPFIASLLDLALHLCELFDVGFSYTPIFTAAAYLLFREKMNMKSAAKTNGFAAIFLVICFTFSMLFASGNVHSAAMAGFRVLIFPLLPTMLVLLGKDMQLYITAILTYAIAFAVSAWRGKINLKKALMPFVITVIITMTCAIASTALYLNRPEAKYGGHAFQYMHGYSSTDFRDYTVYSRNSRLAVPDGAVSLTIENEEDMPVLDGAEACYPLYAAFAKAVYQDIDTIERNWLKEADDQSCNGKIVTFTNTVRGFERLLRGAYNSEGYSSGIDMFFGARPSESQLRKAEESGVELEITPIAAEAFVFFVEADNPVDNLTADQLKAVYHGDIANWSELGGEDQEILAFQRPRNSGSQTIMEYFMGEISLKKPLTYETVPDMMGVIREVAQYANEEGALGYSFRYFLEELTQEKGVKMLSVDGVYPSLENIENGTYPITVDVCLVTRKNDPNPYVQKMIDFILSAEGQTMIKKTGYAGLMAK